ncbi:hypothetical protein GCM10009804_06710 [Kribbella hippodromi]|uniref:Uncharacterized protein n=1 Tax=Kribbella hippodromi TaxID=434347 RepID=A0ABN2C703_9ACTN
MPALSRGGWERAEQVREKRGRSAATECPRRHTWVPEYVGRVRGRSSEQEWISAVHVVTDGAGGVRGALSADCPARAREGRAGAEPGVGGSARSGCGRSTATERPRSTRGGTVRVELERQFGLGWGVGWVNAVEEAAD